MEEQAEELEALESIFDGDAAFSVMSPTSVQYKLGGDGEPDSVLIQLDWPPTYPAETGPTLRLDLFYNHHLGPAAKAALGAAVDAEVEGLLGMPMTFSLIQTLKDSHKELLAPHLHATVPSDGSPRVADDDDAAEPGAQREERRGQMTKTQKRRLWDKGGDDRQRGWNWVCIIRHLAQVPHQQPS